MIIGVTIIALPVIAAVFVFYAGRDLFDAATGQKREYPPIKDENGLYIPRDRASFM